MTPLARPEVPTWLQRRGAIAVAAGLALILLAGGTGPSFAVAVHMLLTDGLLVLLWLLAAFGIGAPLLRVCFRVSGRATQCDPQCAVERGVTAMALGLGALSVLVLLLGLAGWMNRVAAWVVVVAGALHGVYIFWRFRGLVRRVGPWFKERDASAWLMLIVVPVLVIAAVAAMVPPGVLWGADDPAGYDVVEYHLQVPREWYEAGRIAPLRHNVFSYMPFNVEMHYLLAMHLRGGPWAGMYLAQFMHLAMMALMIGALWAMAGPLAALSAAVVPWLGMLGSVAYNEGGLLLFSALAILWSLRGLTSAPAPQQSAPRATCFLVAGLMAGFACGSKLTAAPLLGVFLPLVLLALGRGMLRWVVLYGAALLLAFSPWLVRNQVWAGNPVFPQMMPTLGAGYFSPEQVERWEKAHAPRLEQRTIAARLNAGWKQIVIDWRFGGVLLPAGLVAMALYRRARDVRVVLAAGVLLVLLLLWWLWGTHLQSRFFVPGIVLLAILIEQVRARWWNWLIVPAMVLAMMVGAVRMWATVGSFVGNIGFSEFEKLMPVSVPEGARVLLVGDARAFLYPISRLSYRTVFDVDRARWGDVVEAWRGGRPVDLILVDPNELRRLARTYYGIGPLPPEIDRRSEPFVLTP